MLNENIKNLQCIKYARKSSESDERQAASIEDQNKEIKRVIERHGLNIIDSFEEAKSAKGPGRVEFGKMMDAINLGKAQAITCWQLDRLARNPIDGGNIIWALQGGKLECIVCADKIYTVEDILILYVEFGMAHQYINTLGKNTRRGLRSKAERGWYPCHAPMGYMMNPTKRKGEKEIIVNPEQFDAVRKIWDLVLSGQYNPWQAMQKVTKEYGLRNNKGKTYGKTTAYAMLKNPFYYGEYEYPKKSGNWYKGKHQPMIAKKEFEKVQGLIDSKRIVNNDTKLQNMFMFSGPLTCGQCGCSVIGERKIRITCDCKHRFSGVNIQTCKKCKTHLKDMKNGKLEKHFYYHCTKKKGKHLCDQRSYTPEEVESIIAKQLSQFTLPPEIVEVGLEVLAELRNSDAELRSKSSKYIVKEIRKIESKTDQLLELLMNGDVDKSTYTAKKESLDKEKAEFETSLAETITNEEEEKEKYYFDFAIDAVKEFKEGVDSRKKSIFYGLGSNQSLMDGKLDTVTDSALQELLEVCKVYDSLNEKARTSSEGLNKGKSTPSDVLVPVMLRGQGSNL